MVGLVITIISIAFLAMVLTAGTGYINFDKVTEIKISTDMEMKLRNLDVVANEYNVLFGDTPSNVNDFNNYLIRKLYPDLSYADYGTKKYFRYGLSFDDTHYKKNTGGFSLEVCLGGEIDYSTYYGLLGVEKSMNSSGPKKVLVGSECGISDISAPTQFPEIIWLTYRIN